MNTARSTCSSPKVRISTPSTVRRCDRPHRLPSFAAVAGFGGVLAGDPIRGDLQAHLALASRGQAATLLDAHLAARPDERHQLADGRDRRPLRRENAGALSRVTGSTLLRGTPTGAPRLRGKRVSAVAPGFPAVIGAAKVLEIRANEVSRGAARGVSLAATMQHCSAVLLPTGRV